MTDKEQVKNSIKIHPTAIVCRSAVLEGDVTIGPYTVIHPFAVIRATRGSVVIGEKNLIEERALIENASPDADHVMVIGNENVFEVGAVVRAKAVGNNNVLHVRSVVGPLSTIGNGCSVGPKCELFAHEDLPDKTVIYGPNNNRRIAHDNPQAMHPELVGKLLPSYHHLKKATDATSVA